MATAATIPRIGFRPPAGYAFDIEVFSAADWLKRIPEDQFRHPSRLDFHQMILVTDGHFTHLVDFKNEQVGPKSVLFMHPGQVQRFEINQKWNGWVLIFRPESIQASADPAARHGGLSIDDIPIQLTLEEGSFDAIQTTMRQMHRDASNAGDIALVTALERCQLQTILFRLLLGSQQVRKVFEDDSSLAKHFKRFRQEAEQRLHEWHQMSDYARALGVSEKTLSRAAQRVTGLSGKSYLSKRIALEAKRLLSYTNWPIARIADKLGFDEVTNFIKFFKREAGHSPSEFRKWNSDG